MAKPSSPTATRKRARASGSAAEFNIAKALRLIGEEIKKFTEPIVTTYGKSSRPAFHVLISCMLSLRTKDEMTRKASMALFAVADTPEKIAALSEEHIQTLIKPAGFYRTKARAIREASRKIFMELGGRTPDTIEELLKLHGVGRKTANLVVTLGYGKPGICVDTHVHRICGIWGYTRAKTPDATEMALREKLPRRYWIEFNSLLVAFGQNVCKPVSPLCSQCPLAGFCPRIGVKRSR